MSIQRFWEMLQKYYREPEEPEDTYGSDDDQTIDPDVSSGDHEADEDDS